MPSSGLVVAPAPAAPGSVSGTSVVGGSPRPTPAPSPPAPVAPAAGSPEVPAAPPGAIAVPARSGRTPDAAEPVGRVRVSVLLGRVCEGFSMAVGVVVCCVTVGGGVAKIVIAGSRP
ncbi:hypothetical protein [Tsukamurella soli]|uniref:hypothetical protein n=1 Tax=Tsukamurella soli TaxID=644556 RepID=UPI00361CBFD4